VGSPNVVVLGPLYDPVIANKTVAFIYKDSDDYCGGVIELEPDKVYRVLVSNGEFYVEYEVDGEVDGLLKKLVVTKPPTGAIFIDCTVDDYHENWFDFNERCKFVSIEEFFTRRVLRFLESEFEVECPKDVVKDWVMKVDLDSIDWMPRYLIKNAMDFNSSNQVELCKWLATVALLYLRAYDKARYQPKSVEDLYDKLAYCRVRRRVDLFKASRKTSVFKGLDKELKDLMARA
jgi:hypothetical protein